MLKNITEGTVFVETYDGLKGLKSGEATPVATCVNYRGMVESGFLALISGDQQEQTEEKPAEEKQEQTEEEKSSEEKQEQTEEEKPAEEKQEQTEEEKSSEEKQEQTEEKPAEEKQEQTEEKPLDEKQTEEQSTKEIIKDEKVKKNIAKKA